jgi:tetratricopeptide (TPR) repeat protein
VLGTPRDAGLRLALGRLYEARGDAQLAHEQYEAARNGEPDNLDALLAVAGSFAQQSRFDAAERELRRAVRLDPNRAAAHAMLGIINFRRGLYAQAEAELKRALDLDTTSAQVYYYRGEALNQLNRVDEALDMLERAVRLDAGISRAYYIMGILYDKKRRPKEAGEMYRKARETAPA